MSDWNDYNFATLTKTDFVESVDERFKSIGAMSFDGDTAVPDGFVRPGSNTNNLEKKDGGNWVPLLPPLFTEAAQNVTSDTNTPVTGFDSVYTVESGGYYRLKAIVAYGASDSGIIFSLSNLTVSHSNFIGRFYNTSGTDIVISQSGSVPTFSCAPANITGGGKLILDGCFLCAITQSLTVSARRHTASGTLVIGQCSFFELERIK